MKKRNTPMACPCESGLLYEACCKRWHCGEQLLQAPDAQALMRSRYSAFVLDLPPYLLETWHPRTPPQTIDAPEPGLKWIGLQIKKYEQQDAVHATVEFIARYTLQGRAHRLHENRRFEKIEGRWHYLDGDFIE